MKRKKIAPVKIQQVPDKDFTKEHKADLYAYKPWCKKFERTQRALSN